MKLRCIECKIEYAKDRKEHFCDCGNLLEVVHDFKELDYKELFSKRSWKGSGVWRYKELILDIGDEEIISRNEGNTNLYSSKFLSEYTGIKDIRMKHEGENPTGSFKDRGMTAAISMAKSLGYDKVACASTGNTSASMASYAAISGLKSYVFIPEGNIAYGKLSQALAYGAKTMQVKGSFDKAMEIVKKVCSENSIYLLNSINPYRIEGQKAIFFELMDQLDWKAPDWIVLPGGNLGNTSAFGKAIKESYELGLIDKIPKLGVIQAKGADPFYKLMKNKSALVPMHPETIATAIRIGNPVSWKKARAALKYTDGVVEELSEDEIIEAKAFVDRSGIGAEPASCCSVGGARKLRQEGIIKDDESVVCILTGNLLKDPDVTVKYHVKGAGKHSNKPVTVDSYEEIMKNL